MEELDTIGDRVLDDHSLGVAADELGGRAAQLIGQKQGGLGVKSVKKLEISSPRFFYDKIIK
ncbi:hypothetical protein ES703_79448 [subsurface metagenome]